MSQKSASATNQGLLCWLSNNKKVVELQRLREMQRPHERKGGITPKTALDLNSFHFCVTFKVNPFFS